MLSYPAERPPFSSLAPGTNSSYCRIRPVGWCPVGRIRSVDAGALELPGLTCMHIRCILMHMRTTLNIDDELLRVAQELSGIREKTATVRAALEALIARESARRLAALGGTERHLRPIRRRRGGKGA